VLTLIYFQSKNKEEPSHLGMLRLIDKTLLNDSI